MISAILLAAGFGTRLKPFTNDWPKCLMPIHGYPLLGYWISILLSNKITSITINTHYKSDSVNDFIVGNNFSSLVRQVYEEKLLGTAGTIRANSNNLRGNTLLLIHADNWCQCDFSSFIDFHRVSRPNNCCITMMTFVTQFPESCGIIEVNNSGIVTAIHEKISNPPGNVANAAVYLIEPEVIDYIKNNTEINDFTNDVLPRFLGRIAVWRNIGIHRDIGSPNELLAAQMDLLTMENQIMLSNVKNNEWMKKFRSFPIHKEIEEMKREHK